MPRRAKSCLLQGPKEEEQEEVEKGGEEKEQVWSHKDNVVRKWAWEADEL